MRKPKELHWPFKSEDCTLQSRHISLALKAKIKEEFQQGKWKFDIKIYEKAMGKFRRTGEQHSSFVDFAIELGLEGSVCALLKLYVDIEIDLKNKEELGIVRRPYSRRSDL